MLAHELTHTTEARGARPAQPPRFFGGIGGLFSGGLDRGEQLAHQAGSAVERTAASTSGGGESLLRQLGSNVADLPAGGPALGAGAAVEEIRVAAREAVAQILDRVGSGAEGLAGTAGSLLAQGGGLVGESVGSGVGAAGSVADMAAANVGALASDVGGATYGVAGGVQGVASEVGEAAPGGNLSLGAATDHYSQLSDLMEDLTERLLAEVERRGGRYAGMF